MPARSTYDPVTMPKQSIDVPRRTTRSDTIRYIKQECVEETVSENSTPATNTRSAFILKVKQEDGGYSRFRYTIPPVHDPQLLSTSKNPKKSKLPKNKKLRGIDCPSTIKLEKQDVDCMKSAGRECMKLERETLSEIKPIPSTLRSFSRQGRNSKDYSLVNEQQSLNRASNDSHRANAKGVARLSAASQQKPIRRQRESKKVVLLSDGKPYEPPVTRSRSLFNIKNEVVEDNEGYNLRKFPWRKKRCQTAEIAKQLRTRRVPHNIKVEIDNDSPNSVQPGPSLAPANLIRNIKKELSDDNNEQAINSRQKFTHSYAQAQSALQYNSLPKNPVPEVDENFNSQLKYEISKKLVKKEKLVPEDNNELLNQRQRSITRSFAAQIKQENGDRHSLRNSNLELKMKGPQPKVQTRHHIKTERNEELGGELNGNTIHNSSPSRNKAGRNGIKMEVLEHNNVDIAEDMPNLAPYQTRSAVKRKHRPEYADAPSKSSNFKAPRLVKQERRDSDDKGPVFLNPYATGSSSSSSSSFSPRQSPRKVIGPSKSSRYKVPRLKVKQENRESNGKDLLFLNPYFTQSSSSSGSSFSPRRSSRKVNRLSKSTGYKVPRLVMQKPDSDDTSSSSLEPFSTESSSCSGSSFSPRRSPRQVCQSYWKNLSVKAEVALTVSNPLVRFEDQVLKDGHTLLSPPVESDSVEPRPSTMLPGRECAERNAAKLSARKRASLTRPAKKFAEKMRESPIALKQQIARLSSAKQFQPNEVDVLFSSVQLMEISCEELYTLNQEKHKPDDFCRHPVGTHSNTNPTISPPETKSVVRNDEVDNSLPRKRIATEGRVLRAHKAKKVLPDAERKSQPKRKQTEGNENVGETSVPSPLDVQRKKCLRSKFAEWNLFECSLIELSNQAACDCVEEPVGLDKKLLDELKERRQRGNFPGRPAQENPVDEPGSSQ